jgi:hypothetical protein
VRFAPVALGLVTLAACSLERPIDRGNLDVAGAIAAGGGGVGPIAGAEVRPIVHDAGAPPDAGGLNPEVILASGCATETAQSSLLPANILFVVDRSGSMACNPPPTTSSEQCETDERRADPNLPTKWELTTQALTIALETLPETTVVGVSYFNNGNDCGVDMIPNVPIWRNTAAQRSTISSSLADIQPSGDTPLVGATVLAYRYLHDAALSNMITGNQYVVLITDGEQSEQCSDPSRCSGAAACTQLLLGEVARARGDGVNILTFVIGAPGTEHTRSVLSQIAVAGGTALPNCNPDQGNCHFDVTSTPDLGAALQKALQSIAGQTLTCQLPMPRSDGGVVDPSRLNVVFTPHTGPAKVLRQDNHAPCASGADGWQYSPDYAQIQLCGTTCATVRNDSGGRIDVVLGCPVIGPE